MNPDGNKVTIAFWLLYGEIMNTVMGMSATASPDNPEQTSYAESTAAMLSMVKLFLR